MKKFQYEDIQYETMQYGTFQYETIQSETIQNENIQCLTFQHETTHYGTIHYDSKQNKNFKIKNSYCNVFQKPSALLSSEAFGVTLVPSIRKERVEIFRARIQLSESEEHHDFFAKQVLKNEEAEEEIEQISMQSTKFSNQILSKNQKGRCCNG